MEQVVSGMCVSKTCTSKRWVQGPGFGSHLCGQRSRCIVFKECAEQSTDSRGSSGNARRCCPAQACTRKRVCCHCQRERRPGTLGLNMCCCFDTHVHLPWLARNAALAATRCTLSSRLPSTETARSIQVHVRHPPALLRHPHTLCRVASTPLHGSTVRISTPKSRSSRSALSNHVGRHLLV